MFTTIENLRASTAIQSRVTQVENYLKRTYGNGSWDPTTPFPVAIVLISNTHDDYQWVLSNTSVAVDAPISPNGVNLETVPGQFEVKTKADAQTFVDWLVASAVKYGIEFLNSNGSEAPNVVPADSDVAENTSVQAIPALRLHRAPKIKTDEFIDGAAPTPVQEIGQRISKMRTRKQLDETMQTLLESKMVTTMRPLEKADAVKIAIDVPKGKQAYIVVF